MTKLVLHNNCYELTEYSKTIESDFIINFLQLPVENGTPLIRKDIVNPLSIGKKRFSGKSLHVCPFIHSYELLKFIDNNIMYFSDVIISGFINEKINPDDSVEQYYRDMKIMSKYVHPDNIFYNQDGRLSRFVGSL